MKFIWIAIPPRPPRKLRAWFMNTSAPATGLPSLSFTTPASESPRASTTETPVRAPPAGRLEPPTVLAS